MVRFAWFGESSRRIAVADSVAVIGLGRFGSALALALMESGTEVLGIDTDEELVQSLDGMLTQVVRANATKEEVLRQLAVHEFDRVVVAIGDDVQSSILTCSIVVGMQIPDIWAKAISVQHGRILEQLGVHHVVFPEEAMGRRIAQLVRGIAIDFVEIEPGYALAKIEAPAVLHGVSLATAGMLVQQGVTVTGFSRRGEGWRNADATTVLEDGDLVLVAGATEAVERFARLSRP